MTYKLVAILLLAAIVVLFIIQNVATVEIQFLLWSTRMPRSLMIFLVLGVGVLIGWFLRSFLHGRKSRGE